MWKRALLTAVAVALAVSGTSVLAGLLNRAAPIRVDPIGVDVDSSGMAEPAQPTLSPGPAIPVSPAPVTLGTDDHDDDDDNGGVADFDDAEDTDEGGSPPGTPAITTPARAPTTAVLSEDAVGNGEADDDESGEVDDPDDEDDSGDDAGDGDD